MRYALGIIISILLIFALYFPRAGLASPATLPMLDENLCHNCKKVCAKFGLQKGQRHCHILVSEAGMLNEKASMGSATNDEKMYALHVLDSMPYISLSEDRTQLLIRPPKRDISGSYRVISQYCGLGIDKAVITKGLLMPRAKILDATFSGQEDAIHTLQMGKKDFAVIGTHNLRMIAVDEEDKVVCGGQFIRKKLYLFCRAAAFASNIGDNDAYCRIALERE